MAIEGNGVQKSIVGKRSYDFALRIVKVVSALPRSTAGNIIGRQLLRAGTSIGANVQEALGAETKRQFAYHMSVAKKEARETKYWLDIVTDAGMIPRGRVQALIGETEEILKMLTAIVKTSQRRRKNST